MLACVFFYKIINSLLPNNLLDVELKPKEKKGGFHMLHSKYQYTPQSWMITKYNK